MITRFSGRFKLLSLLQQSEGNTLAATEFLRLLEARDQLQQNNPVGPQAPQTHDSRNRSNILISSET